MQTHQEYDRKEQVVEAEPLSWAQQKRTILIVDDEPDLRTILGKRLSSMGYRVETAAGGIDGLRKIGREKPDLIILDILMPDMDGSEVAAALRENENTQDIPILFLSCLVPKNAMGREVKGRGRSVYMAKPYDAKKLVDTVHRMMS